LLLKILLNIRSIFSGMFGRMFFMHRKRYGLNLVAPLVLVSLIFAGYLISTKKAKKISNTQVTAPVTAVVPSGKYPDLANWKRPTGPLRVGLQAGHWKIDEVPEELKKLETSGGASANGVNEWEVNLDITTDVKKILEEKGIVVDILPATIPEGYYADAFVSIHADGSEDSSVTGYKIASPRRDLSGHANQLQQALDSVYAQITGLAEDPNVTRNMTGYYAFNWKKFDHSLHPMTPATILEMGFITNRNDVALLTDEPSEPAKAIAEGLLAFLKVS
jgi:hypothetical protein